MLKPRGFLSGVHKAKTKDIPRVYSVKQQLGPADRTLHLGSLGISTSVHFQSFWAEFDRPFSFNLYAK